VSRIDDIFSDLRSRTRAALMPFVTAGYPSLDATRQVIPAIEKAGASIVELGIPFSDPIADGPVIASSMHESLVKGVTPRHVLDLVREIRPRTRLGLVAMVSDSIITRMGPEQFVCDAAAAGFDGLIVPDIDLDAARPLAGLARVHNLSFTLLIAPTTTHDRIKHIADLCTGFIYLLARVGITGESESLDVNSLRDRIALVRKQTRLPIAVGFGIARAEHVAAVAQLADAAIVGTALVRRMAGHDPVNSAAALVAELASGLAVRA
jgi:tryptophan synthase alpha chain